MASTLRYQSLSSSIQPEFWNALTQLKIDVLKLDDAAVSIYASYTRGRVAVDRETGAEVGLGCVATLDSTALQTQRPSRTAGSDLLVELKGDLVNFNTIEAFRAADKAALFQAAVDKLWASIQSDADLTPAELNPFLLLTFADLKKYKYFYWFAFPALVSEPAWQAATEPELATSALGPDSLAMLHSTYKAFADRSPTQAGACLAKLTGNGYELATLSRYRAQFDGVAADQHLLIFLDPSPHTSAAGWPLRNILAFLQARFAMQSIRVILWRDSLAVPFSSSTAKSRVVNVSSGVSPNAHGLAVKPTAVGWEKNAAGKLGPRLADLGPMMDPKQLADSAVDLNLKLMRWRILPTLDLDKIKGTRCLLLGAGTLGCYVARNLMAWGVRTITFVDSGRVSFSNPVRQPLFEFADCFEGGKPKAECAAAALTRIYPGVTARGVHLSIPMPGHPIPPTQLDMARADVDTLDALFKAHDVVYLLMDSRESRWLPTMLGVAKGKLVLNAALGFDSYLVMRHGAATATSAPAAMGEEGKVKADEEVKPGQPYRGRLGCYFCNDIVAPTDSLTDRTLDQMCTVTRPGLASLAAASAVELMVSILQHPDGSRAHADSEASVLGAVPHQLRGYLARFETLKIVGQAYDKCTGCSDKIVEAYREQGFDFLLEAFDDAKTLERTTGLDQLQSESEALEGLDWDEAEEEGDE